jgi:hypothetical protein
VEKFGKAGQATVDNITKRTRIATWIPEAKDIHSECVILIAFPPQQWLPQRAKCYVIRTLPIFLDSTSKFEESVSS